MKERLQKIISAHGASSRRAAEEMIKSGRVTVNGRAALIGESADEASDRIEIDGVPLAQKGKRVYIMLNKPRGYVTTVSDDRGRKTVMELVIDLGTRVYPVGRLDLNSEGLLILTNDGDAAQRLMHPKNSVEKEYLAWVRGDLENGVGKLMEGVTLDGRPAGCTVRIVSPGDGGGTLSIIIREGRNRQVRRMCEEAGLYVTRLKRIAEGGIRLGKLPTGKWRHLTPDEVRLITKPQRQASSKNERFQL